MAVQESLEEFDMPEEAKEEIVEENPLLRAKLVRATTYSSRSFNGQAQLYYGLNKVTGLSDGDRVDLILENGIVVSGVHVVKASETEPVLYSNVPNLDPAAALQMVEGKTNQRPTDHMPR